MQGNAIKELHTKSKEELKSLAASIKNEITQLIVKKTSNKDKNVHTIQQRKKDLARILTILKEKETNA